MKKIINENPTLVYGMGICIALLASNNLDTALYTSLTVLISLVLSSVVISVLKFIIPKEIKFVVGLIINALIVSLISMLLNAYFIASYSLYSSIISLIVVSSLLVYNINNIYENSFAKNILNSFMLGISYVFALVFIGIVRQILSNGNISLINPISGDSLFDINLIPSDYTISLFKSNSGAFLTLAILMSIFSKFKKGEE